MPDTVIIGAGPAGLTTAWELSKRGLRSTVVEADELVGGISRTVSYRGYRFDIGGHRFFSKIPYVRELWHDILGEDLLQRQRLSRIFYRGRFFDYPMKAMNALVGLGPVEALLVVMSYTRAVLSPQQEETNFEQWVVNRFGYRLYKIFFKTYTEKVWGIPCQHISSEWAAQRIKNFSLSEALRNALLGNGRTKDGQVITTLIDQFHYPRLGPGMMWERCRDSLLLSGHKVLHGYRVEMIRHKHGRIECAYGRNRSGEWIQFDGDNFVSTMPIRELIHTLDPPPPNEVLVAADALRYRDYLTVVLIVDRDVVFPDNWVYIHSPEVRMGRIQNYKNWSQEMVPDSSKTSLGLEYFLWEKDDAWRWSQQRLIDLGIQECQKIGLVDSREIADGTVVRMKKAYPVYDQAYRRSLNIVKNYLEGFSNLQTIGRNGLHRYNNQDHSMMTGVYAARNITGEQHDVWSVNVEQEYHEQEKASRCARAERLVPMPCQQDAVDSASYADRMIDRAFARLDPLSLGASVGIVCGVGLFLTTIILLVKGGPNVGANLSLLANYLFGFKVTWPGALLGMVEATVIGFILGSVTASLRNWGVSAYAALVRRQAELESRRQILDKV